MAAPHSPASPRPAKTEAKVAHSAYPMRPYDLVKELTFCFLAVALLTVIFATVFSSPDDPPVTLQQWATANPVDFVQTAITELDGSSATARYGPPYESSGSSQSIGPVSLEKLAGVQHPIDTANDFVIGPLETVPDDPSLTAALTTFRAASPSTQAAWEAAYEKAVANATVSGAAVRVPSGPYGPVGVLMSSLLSMARSGSLDGALVKSKQFYTTDYTKVLLFLADGGYLSNLAQQRHLLGTEWGMMNETGSYPGQAWLWLYTMLYQIPPYSTSSSADALVWGTMMLLSVVLLFVPLIPGIRSIPKVVPIYKLIWRDYYSGVRRSGNR